MAILGRNGAGKSTLLSVLAGLRTADAGEVRLGGETYAALGPRIAAKRRGWLAQRHSDAFASTVLETALTGRHPHLGRWDWESKRDTEIARGALKAVGLAELEERDVQTLSGGERQRLAIATLLTQAAPLLPARRAARPPRPESPDRHLNLFAGAAQDCHAGLVMVLHEPGLPTATATARCSSMGMAAANSARRELLTAERLGSLYGHPLKEVVSDDRRWFIPV